MDDVDIALSCDRFTIGSILKLKLKNIWQKDGEKSLQDPCPTGFFFRDHRRLAVIDSFALKKESTSKNIKPKQTTTKIKKKLIKNKEIQLATRQSRPESKFTQAQRPGRPCNTSCSSKINPRAHLVAVGPSEKSLSKQLGTQIYFDRHL